TREIATKFRELAESGRDVADLAVPKIKAELDGVRTELAKAVEAAFEKRQQAQMAELDELRKRLNEIEAAISKREKNREAIINRRVEELINPDVQWEAAASTGFQSSAATELDAAKIAPESLVGSWKV